MKFAAVTTALAVTSLLAACQDARPTADQQQRQQQEQLSKEGNMQVGMPAIRNFQEKRFAKMIIEERDKAIATVTYISTLDGHLLKVCDSIGYGLPYATQYTNPQRLASEYQYPTNSTNTGVSASLKSVEGVIAQADPNGLYSPTQADGTWVLCQDPSTHQNRPVYVEPHVIVSPFPLHLTNAH